eukprot:CAMPEP_0197524692 /NCGR_PEP_ID=MMETSP1318-20131121/9284_1 /TAXON_ID=552666 /ORGANISM="Partenskyella glossopodia, Strain RCC365" /LENGTH=445 /DNA_ID=CAMNT_0043077687 /DNA_START=328 /DNA_END=1665 /DNA_ORIENTATION=+
MAGYDDVRRGERQKLKVKRKRSRSSNIPKAPKKPKTAYNFFQCYSQKKLSSSKQTVHSQNAANQIGSTWRNLSKEDRKSFEDMVSDDKKRYEKEMKTYHDFIRSGGKKDCAGPGTCHKKQAKANDIQRKCERHVEQYIPLNTTLMTVEGTKKIVCNELNYCWAAKQQQQQALNMQLLISVPEKLKCLPRIKKRKRFTRPKVINLNSKMQMNTTQRREESSTNSPSKKLKSDEKKKNMMKKLHKNPKILGSVKVVIPKAVIPKKRLKKKKEKKGEKLSKKVAHIQVDSPSTQSDSDKTHHQTIFDFMSGMKRTAEQRTGNFAAGNLSISRAKDGFPSLLSDEERKKIIVERDAAIVKEILSQEGLFVDKQAKEIKTLRDGERENFDLFKVDLQSPSALFEELSDDSLLDNGSDEFKSETYGSEFFFEGIHQLNTFAQTPIDDYMYA